jgi:hypothetical protein
MDLFSEMWREIMARPSGPFAFRFYLQPMMAAFFAVRDGIRDARASRPPYIETLFRQKGHRKELVRDAWGSVGRVFILAMGIDFVYQITVLHGIRPLAGLLVSITLAIVPYVLLRGPTDRIVRRIRAHQDHEHRSAPPSGVR